MPGTLVVDYLKGSFLEPPAFLDGNGTQTGVLCRAWVNWNGTSGASPVIRGQFNVSSVTRTTTGRYVVTFTNALSNANYSVVAMCCVDGTFGVSGTIRVCQTESTTTQLAGSCVIGTVTTASTVGTDPSVVMASFFR